MKDYKDYIESGRAVLGLEFGSTRIKSVLIDENYVPIAYGSHEWESKLENGLWTYSLEEIISGMQDCYASLARDAERKYNASIESLAAIGISAMMHGYIVLDSEDNLLVPFRTWRNTNTHVSAGKLSTLFGFNIPERWSIAHLYQSIINMETHVPSIDKLTTLAGYIHYLLSGNHVVGVGEASGMFPIDSATKQYDERMVTQFNELIAAKEYTWELKDILPKTLGAGELAGVLSESGAKLLDPSGTLKAGALICPPEGDAGTGMVATNSVGVGTGNVSAGTSIFGMTVIDGELSKAYKTIDMVTTPDGKPVAMVHCNNCTSFLNEWISLFIEFSKLMGADFKDSEIYDNLFLSAENGEHDCGGLFSYNFIAGEPVLDLNEGCPMFVRPVNAKMNLSNFMKMNLYSCVAALRFGFEILYEEGIAIKEIYGHGGFFKKGTVGQSVLSAALNTSVSVMETAGEGGPWGMAILAKYMLDKEGLTLDEYLASRVFVNCKSVRFDPIKEQVKGFNTYFETFKNNLSLEEAAIHKGGLHHA